MGFSPEILGLAMSLELEAENGTTGVIGSSASIAGGSSSLFEIAGAFTERVCLWGQEEHVRQGKWRGR
jgi:hypothetical protein